MSDTAWHTVTVRIPFASNKHAAIAKQVIDVDVELAKARCQADVDCRGRRADRVRLRSPLLRLELLTVDASQDISDVNHPFSASSSQWILGERRSRRSNNRGIWPRGRRGTSDGDRDARVQVMGVKYSNSVLVHHNPLIDK
ncbi:hypothetical protein J3R82DRAFT_11787 [Butyriboletus roseoflavus]|nr:hypothetical protein J3R82DRAFT_11787 [Butyriboletus roseoflavus]